MADEPKDPVVLNRQINCKHSMIRSYGQTRCVHCGIDEADIEKLLTALLWSGAGGWVTGSTP